MLTMTTFKKYKLFINPIEEEKWINNQLVKGYKLVKLSVPGIYTFIESDIDYVVKIDCRTIYSLKKYNEYIALYEDFGWEQVGGQRYGSSNKYWIKKKSDHDLLFSDTETQLEYYRKNRNIITSVLVMLLIYLLTFSKMNAFLDSILIFFILCVLLLIYSNVYLSIRIIENKLSISGGTHTMSRNLSLSFLRIVGFVIVAFIILWLFDTLNINTNNSGVLNSFSNISWIQVFSNSIFNGMFTLVLFIAVVMLVVSIVKSLKK